MTLVLELIPIVVIELTIHGYHSLFVHEVYIECHGERIGKKTAL